MRVGVEVGGTFTDLVAFDGDRIVWDQRLFDLLDAPPELRASGDLYVLWCRHVPPEDVARLTALMARCKAEGCPLDFEYRLRRADGGLSYIHSAGIVQRDAQGRPRRLIGANRDLTPQREMEASLKESKEWLELALSSAGMASHRSGHQANRTKPDHGHAGTRRDIGVAHAVPGRRQRVGHHQRLFHADAVRHFHRVRIGGGHPHGLGL